MRGRREEGGMKEEERTEVGQRKGRSCEGGEEGKHESGKRGKEMGSQSTGEQESKNRGC